MVSLKISYKSEFTSERPTNRTHTPTPALYPYSLLPVSMDLTSALRDCYGPTHRNIVDAGLIKSATLTSDLTAPGAGIPGVPTRHLAHITLYAPSTDEVVNLQLVAQVENRLLGLEAISRVEITLLPALFPIL